MQANLHVAVVVLGDLGRSPRMQYHALSLAEHGATVSLIGLAGEFPIAAVRDHPRIRIHSISDLFGARRLQGGRTTDLARAAARAGLQIVQLAWLLLRTPRPDFVLVQNPPALPSLPIAWLAARLRGATLIIDWHNLSYSIVALRLPPRHPIVRLVAASEHIIGERADLHLSVSEHLRERLRREWQIEAITAHDRPARAFRPISRDSRKMLLERLGFARADGKATGLIVTATSWTPDEDFSLLLEALVRLDQRIAAQGRLSPLQRFPQWTVVITGKGPLRAPFEQRIAALSLRHVALHTAWLPWPDYEALLGAADLGLSLHRSSSGVDLPMKILDMFGAGLPVAALDYGPCLDELIRPGVNGVLFRSSGDLASQLFDLFVEFPERTPLLDELRRGASFERGCGWDDSWNRTVAPLFGFAPR